MQHTQLKVKCDQDGIKKASQIIEDGGIIIFPTDTVYGIGCNPYNNESIQKIYKIKKRSNSKSLPILAFSIDVVSNIAEFDNNSKKIAKKFWPGALTIILKLTDKKLKESLQLQKIAVRIPNHQYLLEILKKSKLLVGTSANLSGRPSFSNPEKCFQEMNGFDLFIDGGVIQNSGESTVIEFNNGKLIIHREGIISRKEIFDSL